MPGRSSHRKRRDPAPLSALLGLALPRKLQKRFLDLELLSDAFREVAPDRMVLELEPVSFERGVLTLQGADPDPTSPRERAALARRVLEAAGAPAASLRIRIVAGT